MGAAIAHGGWGVLHYQSIVEKVVLPLFLSPFVGFIAGFVLMRLLARTFANAHPRTANRMFRRLQIGSSAFMAISHGMNDAQKTMGIIALALVIFQQIPEFHVPFWVRLMCSSAMFLGTLTGGWKIIKTMGHKIFKIEPVHGFAAETSAAMVIVAASTIGAPISTTHVISTSVIGVGASKRLSAVRWGVAGRLLVAWVVTIPASACVGALSFAAVELVRKLFGG
jgi:PiT family inorganic phosphate transporter